MQKSTVNREELLRRLDAVASGLAARGETIEQSSCLALRGGRVHTFNDETFCSGPTGLGKEIEGAVAAKPLQDLLRKLPDEEVSVSQSEGVLRVSGQASGTAELRMESEITLQIDAVEKPEKWLPLPPEFGEAVGTVQHCAAGDGAERFETTCIHVHPKWVEAADGFQLCRWKIKTGIETPTLVRQVAVRAVNTLDVSEMAETPNWLHFRNASGLTLSCRRYLDEYPDLTGFLKVEGESVQLSKKLGLEADIAKTFTSEVKESDRVLVKIKDGKVRVVGEGVSGRYTSRARKVAFTGEIAFYISPKLLTELVTKHSECVLSPDRLLVNSGKFRWCVCLVRPDEVQKGELNGDGAEPESDE